MKEMSLSGAVRGGSAKTNYLEFEEACQPRIKRQWKPYYGMLRKLRERLLSEQMEQLSGVTEPLEGSGRAISESTADVFEQELDLTSVSRGQNLLLEVEEALERLQEGTYGICQLTHLPIEVERLRVIPWTRFSKGAAAHLQRENARSGAKCRGRA
jgi:DnaK suppressor protein